MKTQLEMIRNDLKYLKEIVLNRLEWRDRIHVTDAI